MDHVETQVFLEKYFDNLPGTVAFFARGAPYNKGYGKNARSEFHWVNFVQDHRWESDLQATFQMMRTLNEDRGWSAQWRISTMQEIPQEYPRMSMRYAHGLKSPALTGQEDACWFLPALFADVDNAPMSIMLWQLSEFDPQPSLVIKSSDNGLHVFWLLDDPIDITDYADWRGSYVKTRLWAGLCDAVADVRTNDATRWGRLPGFLNAKDEYGPDYPTVELIHADWNARYNLEAFEKYALPEPKRRFRDFEFTDEDRGRLPDVTEGYIENPPINNRHNTLFDVACQLRDARYDYDEAMRMVAHWEQPGFTYREIEACVASVFRSPARQPIPTRQMTRRMHRKATGDGH